MPTQIKCGKRLLQQFNNTSEIPRLTLAEISLQRIRVERWWTYALAGLHTLLVSLALVVVGAPLLRGRTKSVVRVAAVSVRAYALMRTW